MIENDMIIIIALCGKIGTGKTTVAKYLLDKHGYTRLRFADPIKKMLSVGLGIDDSYIDGNMKESPCAKLCGKTARYAMQTLGTEWGRNKIGKDIWVFSLYTSMCRLINDGVRKFVIDDLRFLSESEWLRKLVHLSDIPNTVHIIRLERDGVEVSNHQSERELDRIGFKWLIYNNDVLEVLYRSVDDILLREKLIV